jgi:predicted O-methyltransferase YrrM
MDKLNSITSKYHDLPYMTHEQALYMRGIILKHGCKSLCELGHFHGKSSVYMGSILEEQGFGKLTTFDLKNIRRIILPPRIEDLIKEFSLENYINPVITDSGYIWDMIDMIEQRIDTFDFCYIDGTHTFESTLSAFILVDKLMEDGGIVIFDDYSWCLDKVTKIHGNDLLNAPKYKAVSPREFKTPPVKKISEIIMPEFNYTQIDLIPELDWIVYRKNSK